MNDLQETTNASDASSLSLAIKDFLAGCVGGVAQIVAGHPFDTLKVRLQTQEPGQTRFKGPIDCLLKTVREEGVKGLYKGMAPPIAGVAAVNAVLFMAYGQAKSSLQAYTGNENLTKTQLTLAGAYAGLANCVVICPVELLKARVQVQYPGYTSNPKGPWEVATYLYKQYGAKSLFTGMTATIYREVPAYAAYFGCYELSREILAKREGKASVEELSPLGYFISGGLGGIGCWLFSYPQDLIKSRLQVQENFNAPVYKKNKFLLDGGFWNCGKQVMKALGPRGLFVGFAPTIIRAFPANAATFFAYEYTKKLLS